MRQVRAGMQKVDTAGAGRQRRKQLARSCEYKVEVNHATKSQHFTMSILNIKGCFLSLPMLKQIVGRVPKKGFLG